MSTPRKTYKRRKKATLRERLLWQQLLDDNERNVERAAHAHPWLYERIHGKPPEPFDDRPEERLDR